jgi:hypothetical protein
MPATTSTQSEQPSAGHWRRYRTVYLLLAVCAAPVIASYLAYYVLPPSNRTNYGELIEPQRPIDAVVAAALDGAPVSWSSLRGNWIMVQAAPAACVETCKRRLWLMRQVRATTGKDRDRVERVWLVTDGGVPDAEVMREFTGTVAWRAGRDLAATLPPESGRVEEHIWLVDPLGNVMMRWPRDADPNRMKKDLARVLRASRIG